MSNQVQILNPSVVIIADVNTDKNFNYVSCADGYQNVPELWNLSYTVENGKLYYRGDLQDFFGYNYHDDAPNELGTIVNSLSNVVVNGMNEADYFAAQQYPINLGYWFSKREAAKPAKQLLDATLKANKEAKWNAMLAEQAANSK